MDILDKINEALNEANKIGRGSEVQISKSKDVKKEYWGMKGEVGEMASNIGPWWAVQLENGKRINVKQKDLKLID